MQKYDYLIVGSGLFGATIAHRAKQAGKRCLVIEKRAHLGGNVYCENIEGINVHKYGAHIFHTSDKAIWDFVNSFVPFNGFINSPLANYKGKLYNLPFSMNTFMQMWDVSTPDEALAIFEKQHQDAINQLGGKQPQNLEQQALLMVGKDIYETLIKDYTEKQWGRPCTDLPAFIIQRIPVRFAFDNNYFTDTYQGVPIGGYNKLIEGLLSGIECIVNCDFFDNYKDCWRDVAYKLIYTGPLDAYFGFKLGTLEWRTITMKTFVLEKANHQSNAVINYTSHDHPYTRTIEHKHFEMFGKDVDTHPKTVVSEEYAGDICLGGEPCYPINTLCNNQLAQHYKALAIQEKDVVFGGRLAEYQYYNMDQVVARALKIEI